MFPDFIPDDKKHEYPQLGQEGFKDFVPAEPEAPAEPVETLETLPAETPEPECCICGDDPASAFQGGKSSCPDCGRKPVKPKK